MLVSVGGILFPTLNFSEGAPSAKNFEKVLR
jgi:hypothetical protein